MQSNKYLFTSESVSEGHPDKVCDRISDMVVDSYLSKDPVSRVACETLTTTNKVVLAGINSSVSLQAYPNIIPWSPAPSSLLSLESTPIAISVTVE